MKIIKNILFCVIVAVSQANFCMADAQQDNVDKNQVVVENQQSDAIENPDTAVENKPYITKAAMFKIAVGMLVAGVAWRCIADYYGVFPFHPAMDEDNQSELHTEDESIKQLESESVVMHEQGQPVVEGISDSQKLRTWGQFAQVLQNNAHKELQYWFGNFGSNATCADEQTDDWAAKYEREARADEAERDEKYKARQAGLAKFAQKNYPSDESNSDEFESCDNNYSSDDEAVPELESCDAQARVSSGEHQVDNNKSKKVKSVRVAEVLSSYDEAARARADVDNWAASMDNAPQHDNHTQSARELPPVRFANLPEVGAQVVDSQNIRTASVEAIQQRIAELRADAPSGDDEAVNSWATNMGTNAPQHDNSSEQVDVLPPVGFMDVANIEKESNELNELRNKIDELISIENQIEEAKRQAAQQQDETLEQASVQTVDSQIDNVSTESN